MISHADNVFAGTTPFCDVPEPLEYLWEYFIEIIPVPRSTDFNGSVRHWAELTGVRLTRRELGILKTLYMTMLKRADDKTPPMQKATPESLLAVFSAMAARDKKDK